MSKTSITRTVIIWANKLLLSFVTVLTSNEVLTNGESKRQDTSRSIELQYDERFKSSQKSCQIQRIWRVGGYREPWQDQFWCSGRWETRSGWLWGISSKNVHYQSWLLVDKMEQKEPWTENQEIWTSGMAATNQLCLLGQPAHLISWGVTAASSIKWLPLPYTQSPSSSKTLSIPKFLSILLKVSTLALFWNLVEE